MKKQISLAIADDHPLFVEGLVSILKEDFVITGTAKDGYELLDLLKINLPDIVLIDLNMPRLDGLSACQKIAKDYPLVKSVILSFYYNIQIQQQLMQVGIRGYLTKGITGNTLIKQIKHIAAGGTIFHTPQIPSTHGSITFHDSFIQQYHLSPRELEIISLIRTGLTSNEISQTLFISINTVEAHRKHIFQKLQIKNLQGLVEFANHHSL